jgi:hypothetical protein
MMSTTSRGQSSTGILLTLPEFVVNG